MRYDTVFFDCDGTLVDTEMMIVELVRGWCAEAGCPVDRHQGVRMVVGISWAATYHAIGQHLRAHGQDLDDAAVEHELHRRLAPRHFDPALVIPSTAAALRRAAALLPVDVVSGSTPAQVERHLENAGVRPLVRRIIGDGMYSAGKPDPAPYLLAARLAGVAPTRCLTVEDSPVGVRSARAAGVAVIGLDRHHHSDLRAAGADLVLEDLAGLDLAAVLRDGLG